MAQEKRNGRFDPDYTPAYRNGGFVLGLDNGHLIVHNGRRLFELDAEGQILLERNFTPSIQQPNISYSITSAIIDAEQRIVTFGYVGSADNNTNARIRRFHSGTLEQDSSFPDVSGFDGRIRSIAELPGRGYVIAGEFRQIGLVSVSRVALINYDGSVAPGYGHSANSNYMRVVVGSDNGVYVSNSNNVFRLDANGEVDPTYKTFYAQFENMTFGLVEFTHPLSNGRLLVVTNNNGQRILHIKNADGTNDPVFNTTRRILDSTRMVGAPGLIRAVAEMDDGRIILAGDFTDFGELPVVDHFRINADGSFDDTYDASAAFALGSITSLVQIPGFVYFVANAPAVDNLNRVNDFQGRVELGGGPVRVFTSAEPGLSNLMGQSVRSLGNGFYHAPGFGIIWEGPGGLTYSDSLKTWVYFNLRGPALDDPQGLWFMLFAHNQFLWLFSESRLLDSNDRGRLVYVPSGLPGAPAWFLYNPVTKEFSGI
ncbi:MAG: hypothetical protein LR015_04795 [Verrucomicrobia bacterium]|nr:hypothetical protein [Verrucomicrobiota bacterium]